MPTPSCKTDHLKRSLRRITARIQQDQHTGDDRAVDLYLNALLLGAQQVTAAK